MSVPQWKRTPRACAISASRFVNLKQSPVSSPGSRSAPTNFSRVRRSAGSTAQKPSRSSTSKGTPYWRSTSTSLPMPSSCFWVRKSCSVPCVRSSYAMPVSARSAFRQSRLYSAIGTMRLLFSA